MNTKPWKELFEDAVSGVAKYMESLSDEEFEKLLNEHMDGDIAAILQLEQKIDKTNNKEYN